MPLRIAGFFLIVIALLFVYEIFLINYSTNNLNLNFLSESEKVIDKLKICGTIQILLLLLSGMLMALSGDDDEINELKKRISKLEK